MIDMELEYEYLDGVVKAWGQRIEVVEQIDLQYGGCEVANGEGLQDEDVEMIGFAQVLTSSMSEEQWKAFTAMLKVMDPITFTRHCGLRRT